MQPMTAAQVATRLGVKVDTVYAYVSRGSLRSWKDPVSKTSRFDPDEVEALARRGRPRRTSRPPVLDFTIESELTAIGDHDVSYRGRSAFELTHSATFEEVAHLLWTGQLDGGSPTWSPLAVGGTDLPANRDRLSMAVVLAAAADPFRADLTKAALPARAGSLIATMTEAVAGPPGERTARLVMGDRPPLRGSIAGRLWARLATGRRTPGLVEATNAALVLLADHELAASTLAARVAASTRADPYAVVLAGLATVSGPLHGGASRLAYQLLEWAAAIGPDAAIARALELHQQVPGFGHPLYPLGDPRARVLLDAVRAASPGSPSLVAADRVAAAIRDRAQLEANIDFALAVLARTARMPEDAGEVIFAIARTAGWIAHGIEEYAERPLRFRARAATHR